MKKIKAISVIFALVVLGLPALLSFGIRFLPVNDQSPLGLTQKLFGNKIVKDTLTLPENNFNGIGLSFKNPNLINKKEVVLKLSKNNGEIIRTATLSGWNIPDGGFVRFMFAPIPDSQGNEYLYTLSAPSSKEEEALEIYLSEGSEGMASVAYYKPPGAPRLIGEIYSNWMERFLKDKAFAAFYLSLMALGIGYLAFGKKETI